jgi:hypothetical protein
VEGLEGAALAWTVDHDRERVELLVTWPSGKRRVITSHVFGGDYEAAKGDCLSAAADFGG